jgi:hypothetical protein
MKAAKPLSSYGVVRLRVEYEGSHVKQLNSFDIFLIDKVDLKNNLILS